MKNPIFICVVAFLLFFASCKKDSPTQEKSTNSLKVDGIEYEISKGILMNYGGDGTKFNIELDLFSSGIIVHELLGLPDSVSGAGHGIVFNIYSSSSDKLTLGEYSYNKSNQSGSFDDAYYVLNWDIAQQPTIDLIQINIGTIKVIKSGLEYELSFTGTDASNKVISVYYKGSLKYYKYNL